MGTVIMHNVVSVDGFIADENDAVKPLHEWYFNGDTPITGTRDQEFDHSGAGVLSKPGLSTSSPLTLSPSFWAGVDDCLTPVERDVGAATASIAGGRRRITPAIQRHEPCGTGEHRGIAKRSLRA